MASLTKEAIKELSRKHNEPEWMLQKRLAAFAQFESTEMPELRYGLHIFGTYGDLQLDKLNFSQDTEESGSQHGVEVLHAQPGIIIEDLHAALRDKERSELIKQYFMTACIKPEENKFTALHAAFWQRGLLIHVPKEVEVKQPIHIRMKTTGDVIEHVLVIAELSSKIDIVEEVVSEHGEKLWFRSGLTEIFAKEYAQVQFASIQNLGSNVFNFTIKRANIEKEGRADWLDCVFGSSITISDITSMLNGHRAKSNNWSVFFGDKKQTFDFSMKSVHGAPDTFSDIRTKGVLDDHAKSIYRGNIKIKQWAARSNGYQKEDTLLLSDTAENDSIPKLEIDTNDVKCSHGAAIGQVDEEKLFYMMSRGIPEALAKKRIEEGFSSRCSSR